MAENTAEMLVGAGVLAVALGFVVYAGQIAGFRGVGDTYPLEASFRSAEGVGVGTDVRLAGVKVGTVTALELNPETFRADAWLAVKSGVVLPEDTAALISSEGLLGGSFVELQPGGSLVNLEPGAVIENTQGAVSLVTLLLRFVTGSEGAE